MNDKLTGKASIRILHLSDFHLREGTRWDADVVLKGLKKAIRKFVDDGLGPDVVAITGDLAHGGKKTEYDEVRRWFDKGLLPALGGDFPLDRILVVPGNHDVDRAALTTATRLLQTGLLDSASQEMLAEVLRDPNPRAGLLGRHRSYIDFARQHVPVDGDLPWWKRTLDLHGTRVHFAGLCSSWMSCSKEDKDKLLLSRYQVHAVLDGADEADLCVALVHHPWDFLAEFDHQDDGVVALIEQRANILLHGHRHRQRCVWTSTPDGWHLVLSTGSAYAGSDYQNAFQLVEIDRDEIRVHFRIWHKNTWKVDRNAYENAADGIGTFPLHDAGSKAAPAGMPPRRPRTQDPTPYLRHLLQETAHIDIRGLVSGNEKAHQFPIEELYIPLRTTIADVERRKSRPKDEVEMEASRSVELHVALRNRRLVVIGDPGSGKSTFLRRIAHTLAEDLLNVVAGAANSRLGLEGDPPLPLLVRLSELAKFVEKHRDDTDAPDGTAARWIPFFLAVSSRDRDCHLEEAYVQNRLKAGTAFLLLDGLDEAPNNLERKRLTGLIESAASTYEKSAMVVTSRPKAYVDEVIINGFDRVDIAPLDADGVETFVKHWCRALFKDAPSRAESHKRELLAALRAKVEIRKMASNPVMLTALAVVHWNEKSIPAQRSALYESIVSWLSKARELRPGRATPDECLTLLQEVALEMQDAPEGRRVQVPRIEAAQWIAQKFDREPGVLSPVDQARRFLQEEEIDSGIIVARGEELRFWHLTFQEFLAARSLTSRTDRQQEDVLRDRPEKLFTSDWRETLQLLAGILCGLGEARAEQLCGLILDLASQEPLRRKAQCVGLLGGVLRDLASWKFRLKDGRYEPLRNEVMAIFDPIQSESVPLAERIEAADELGRAGDPRLDEDCWIRIDGGTFWMGAQKKKKKGRNHDSEAFDDESPVHEVTLDPYFIARFPVTVQEYEEFVSSEIYGDRRWWDEGGAPKEAEPESWEQQLEHPNRPVVGVSWFEATAFAAWLSDRTGTKIVLPTEAQWEYAARGKEGRKWSWGDDPPEKGWANIAMSEVGHPTPVGVFPKDRTPEGVMDMTGNVSEWCRDWNGNYSVRPGAGDGYRDVHGSANRVIRGGYYWHVPRDARAAYRRGDPPEDRYADLGFRLARFST